MTERKPSGYWTKERCYEEALKYMTKSEFKRKSVTAYCVTRKNGWLDELCPHMTKVYKKWTKETCHEEALKHKTKVEFIKNSKAAYISSYRNGWYDEICSHMDIVGNLVKRLIYVYEFSDKSAYIGLTDNMNRRNNQHMNIDSPVKNHMIETSSIPTLIKLTNYIPVKQAQDMEDFFIEQYRENGWNILNSNKAGALGGIIVKWTKENCHIESLKYKTRIEFVKKNNSAYVISWRNGWLNEICLHMKPKKLRNYWNYETCKEESKKYNRRGEFAINSVTSYIVSLKNGWLDEFFPKK